MNHIQIVLEKNVDQSKYVDELRNKLVGLGFNEMVTNSLLNEEKANLFGKPIALMNPNSKEMSHLRTSLIPGALTTISNNLKVREPNLSLFEIGHTFENVGSGKIKSFDDISEREILLMVITGNANEDEWYSKARPFTIYDMKGSVEELLSSLSISDKVNSSLVKEENGLKNLIIYSFGKERIAKIAQLDEDILKLYDIEQQVYMAEIDIDKLKTIELGEKKFQPLLKYPKIIRDCAFILDKKITNSEVEKTIYEGSSKLLKNIKLFDIFESNSLGEGKKSLAFQLEYFDSTRTLTEEEVDKDFWKAIETVKTKLNAKLRGG
jgi:phenylalanyl-tRNA synthetase beta chain